VNGDPYDAIVIGGGFYGCVIALHLARELKLAKVAIVEREAALLSRASFTNQARVHHGYHYPRDFTTAYRSRANFGRFAADYREAIVGDFVSLYAIARRNSHLNGRQFERAMAAIGAPCQPATPFYAAMFSPVLVEAVFETREFAFDAHRLAASLLADLDKAGVEILLGADASLASKSGTMVKLAVVKSGTSSPMAARCVFNCTYGQVGHVQGIPAPEARIRYQVAEVCLVEPPQCLVGVGVTVMDGPFFSCMPFPARGLHSLTHVAYTPHAAWIRDEIPDRNPDDYLKSWPRDSSFDIMKRDAARLLPQMSEAVHKDSLFEIKTLLVANAVDDGRPILVEGEPAPGQVVSVLGGKLDNIYDVLTLIDERQRLTP
jgi:glycine/D-amino acid oxidase-like deaminating enzyme